MDCGASGFIPKSSDNDLVLHAIRLVLAGGVYTPAAMLEYLDVPLQKTMEGVALHMDPAPLKHSGLRGKPSLTSRQLEVLKLISLGKTNKNIADELNLSSNTVKVHVTAILQVLHTTNRTEAVIVATELGLF
jgi:DNA-binding NarL/FixJ family response regulator